MDGARNDGVWPIVTVDQDAGACEGHTQRMSAAPNADDSGSDAATPNLDAGWDLEEAGDAGGAEAAFRAALAASEAGSALALGSLLTKLGQPREAMGVLNAAVKAGEEGLNLAVGNAFQDLAEFEQAIEAFYAAAEVDGDPAGWHNAGRLLRWLERFDDAVPLWRAAHEAGHTGAEAFASLLADAGQYDEAIAILGLLADEGDAEMLVEIGAIEQERFRFVAAERVLRAAIDQGAAGGYVYLANVLTTTDRPEEALAVLEAGAAQGAASAQLQLANELAKLDASNERIEPLYRKALARGDEHAATNLGIHLLELGRTAEALELLEASADGGDELARIVLAEQAPPTES